jgi:hypothetical protein
VERQNYFLVSSFLASGAAALAESAGFAGAAVIVSAGAAGAAGAVVAGAAVAALAVESLVLFSPPPLPQEATKSPNERASTLNFTNFILSFLNGYAGLYLILKKVTRSGKNFFTFLLL